MKTKLLFFSLLMLGMGGSLFAQNPAAVTGTILDPNSVPYYPAQVTACLTPNTLDPTVGGKHVNNNIGTNYCVGSVPTAPDGSFALSLFANGNITPAATQWVFTVQTVGAAPPAGKGSQSFTTAGVTISGSSQSVTSSFTGLPALLNSGSGSGAFSGGLGTTFQDATEIATPANPAAGNDRLSVNSTTHLLVCQTSGGGSCMPTGGSPSFASVTAGTNAAPLVMGTGGSLTTSGTGINNANQINGTALSGLATGIVKNTTATGVPSIAVAGDFPTLNQNTSGTAANVTGVVAPANGGTGVASPTVHSIPVAEAGSNFNFVASPTANGDYGCLYHVTGAAAVDPTCPQVGQGGRAITGAATTDTVLFSDVLTPIHHDKAASGAVNQALPTATTLGNASFAYSYCNHSAQTDTITPTTWTIQAGNVAAGATLSVASGTCYRIKVDPNSATNWLADATGSSGGSGDMLKNAANTMGASGTIDNSAETAANAFKVPVQAGAVPTADGSISVNSTTHLPNVGANGATTTLVPADPTNVIYERDDFIGLTNTGIFGHGWTIQGATGAGGTAPSGAFSGDANHPFGVRVSSGAVSGNFAFFTPHGNSTSGSIANSVGADFWFIFRLEQAATAPQQELWVGFRDTQTAADPTNGIFLRTVGTTAKANYFFVCRAAGVETTVDSTVLMDTAVHKLRVHVNSSSSISFTLDAGATQTIATNVPSVGLSIGIDIATSEAITKVFDMYNFTFLQPVSR